MHYSIDGMNVHPDWKEKLVKTPKIIILTLLSLVFVVYGMGFMMYRGIDKTLLDQQYYNTVIGEYGIASSVHGALGDMIAPIVLDGLTGGTPVTDAKEKAAVDKQVSLISTAITDALDEDWIEEQALMVTSDVVGLLNAEKSSLTAIIDLKGKLSEIENNIASGLEKFSDAELFAMFGAPRAYIPVIAEQIVGKLGLPESLVIADLVDASDPGTLEMVSGHLGTMDSIFGILAWLVIIVFLVLCLLFWKFGGGLQWFGLSTALTGALFLGLISFLSNLQTIENYSGVDFESLPVDSSLLQSIIGFTFSEMRLMPILFLVGGVVLFALGSVVRKADR